MGMTDDYVKALQANPADQAAMQPETFANPMVKALLEGTAKKVAVPGQVMTPNPYPPGSEESDWFEGQRYNRGMDWAHRTAVGIMGGGAPMAEQSALGMAGGRISKGRYAGQEREAANRDYYKMADQKDVARRNAIKADLAANPVADNIKPRSPTGYIDELIAKNNAGTSSITEDWILKRLLKDRYE
jgi:hypothetical protein